MSKDLQRQRSGPQRPDAVHPRTDFRTRDVVNQAIAAVPTVGIKQAAEFLAAMNVPADVAIRALLPNRRDDEPLPNRVPDNEAPEPDA